MTKIYKKYLTTTLLIVLAILPLLAVTQPLLLVDPPVWPDEPIFASIADNFASTGELKTSIHGSQAAAQKNSIYGYPPVYFYVLGSWVWFFGDSIEAIRLSSVTIAVLTLVTFFFLALKLTGNKLIAFYAVLALSLDYQFSQASRISRMEILVIFFTLVSILLTLHARTKKKSSLYVAAGIFSALSFLTHPIGLLAFTINFLFILLSAGSIRSKIKPLLLLITPLAFGLCLWIFNLGPLDHFLADLQKHLSRKANLRPYIFTLFQIDFNFKMTLLSEIAIILWIAILGLVRSVKRHQNLISSELLLILVSVVVSLAFIISGKEVWYLTYLTPFAYLAVIFLLKNALHFKSKLIITLAILLLNLPLFFNLAQLNNIFVNNSDKNYHLFASQISEILKNSQPICISSIPDPYFELKLNPNADLYEFIYLDTDVKKQTAFMDNCNSVVLNFAIDPTSNDYIKRNVDKQLLFGTPPGYATYLIILRDKKDRI